MRKNWRFLDTFWWNQVPADGGRSWVYMIYLMLHILGYMFAMRTGCLVFLIGKASHWLQDAHPHIMHKNQKLNILWHVNWLYSIWPCRSPLYLAEQRRAKIYWLRFYLKTILGQKICFNNRSQDSHRSPEYSYHQHVFLRLDYIRNNGPCQYHPTVFFLRISPGAQIARCWRLTASVLSLHYLHSIPLLGVFERFLKI